MANPRFAMCEICKVSAPFSFQFPRHSHFNDCFFLKFVKSIEYIQFELTLEWCVEKLTRLTVRFNFYLFYFYPDGCFIRDLPRV